MTQVTIPNKGSTSPGRSRRGKPRYRKAGKGSSSDLAQLKATLSSSLAMINATSSIPSSKHRLDPTAAIRGLQHDLLLKKMSSSSPDLISTTLEAEGRRKGLLRPGLDRAGSQSASAGLEDSGETEGPRDGQVVGVGGDDLVETPPQSNTPSEDAASIPFSSSPDSPCGRGAAAGRASVLGNSRVSHEGENKEEGTVMTRSPRSQRRLTPAALLYRAAVTRSQEFYHNDKSADVNIFMFLILHNALMRTVSISKCQSLSNFSLENLSVSDGEEGNTTDHSHSGTPDVVSTNTDERLDDKSDDLLSQGSEIPADPCDPSQLGSDGLSEREAEVRQVRTQLALSEHNYEVGQTKTAMWS
ncbi:hypothetical protein GOODEAATRI_018172 [Goodea atripinnis]|uniref:Uncharacterized protein n=1 Tax=Goodea atripinnis TaxID=208336 RepID=A0ABV0PZ51_9TELE